MIRRLAAIGLACVMGLSSAPAAAAAQAQEVGKLNIVILEGEGAINNIRQRTAREPIVQVEDENHRPIAGAVVLFSLPDRGASGVFANGQTSMAVTTDAQGRAVATGLRPNNVQGDFQIRVHASYQGKTASTSITQSNAIAAAAVAAGGVSGKTIGILIAIAGAAAAGGAIAATRGGSRTAAAPSAPPSVTLSVGTPTVSPPR